MKLFNWFKQRKAKKAEKLECEQRLETEARWYAGLKVLYIDSSAASSIRAKIGFVPVERIPNPKVQFLTNEIGFVAELTETVRYVVVVK